LRELKKDLSHFKRTCGFLETEQSRLRTLLDQKEVEILKLSSEKLNLERHSSSTSGTRSKGGSGFGLYATKEVLSEKLEKNEAYIKNLKRKLAKSEKSHSDTRKLMESYREKYQTIKAMKTRDNRNTGIRSRNTSMSKKNSLHSSGKKFERKNNYSVLDESRGSRNLFKRKMSLREERIKGKMSHHLDRSSHFKEASRDKFVENKSFFKLLRSGTTTSHLKQRKDKTINKT
jgi:hypothetical protein